MEPQILNGLEDLVRKSHADRVPGPEVPLPLARGVFDAHRRESDGARTAVESIGQAGLCVDRPVPQQIVVDAKGIGRRSVMNQMAAVDDDAARAKLADGPQVVTDK